ncbi:MAG: glutamine--fructose-6-phosphate transaminase (isomerizing), partial [Candidatus Micrarchaeota archaeon]|nr:glutamine--fructose-6-phosphate transaminase (isomerizing) [Candidatus Micrarchaeota archaeon]
MCGILGIVSDRPVAALVVEGLRKLEYRGYDSCGVASVDGGRVLVKKGVGRIEAVEKAHGLSTLSGTAAIGHTRWSTHGGVSDKNAHPHLDCTGEIAVAHNGIIENFQDLRARLSGEGHRFASDTDSEIIAHLIEAETGAFAERVRRAALQLEGSFAILAVSSQAPGVVVAVRRESPLCVGVSGTHAFASSDVMPFLAHTREAVFLEDDQMAVLRFGAADYVDVHSGAALQKKARTLDWDEKAATKEGHPFYMIKEILEQPRAIRDATRQDPHKLARFVELLQTHSDVKFVACGTSRHAALVGRYAINQITGKSAEVYIASEFDYFADQCTSDTLLVAVSQSGETADVLVGLRKAKAKGAKVASIVNAAGSSIDRESDVCLYLNCGPEIAVASTKAFTAQLSVFYTLAFALAGKPDEGRRHLEEAAKAVKDFLPVWQTRTAALSKTAFTGEHAYFLARGVNFPLAMEGALKLKEISYIHAEGMPAGELKHGTLALVEKGTPVVLINPHDYTFPQTLSNGMETQARGAFLLGVSDQNNAAYDAWLELPKVDSLFYPLVAAPALQLLAYH